MLMLTMPCLPVQRQGESLSNSKNDVFRLKKRSTEQRRSLDRPFTTNPPEPRQNSEESKLYSLLRLLRAFGLYKSRTESVIMLLVISRITVIVSNLSFNSTAFLF